MWLLGVPVARLLARLGWKLRVFIEEPLPSGPMVVAPNHLSHLDPPMVAVAIGRPMRFLAVDGLWGVHRWLNVLLYLAGSIPLSRTRPPLGAMKSALRHLRSGGSVGIFPEGGVVAEWGSAEPHPAAAALSLRSGAPLIPVALIGTGEAYGKNAQRVRLTRIRVTVGPAISPAGYEHLEDPAAAMMAAWGSWMASTLGN